VQAMTTHNLGEGLTLARLQGLENSSLRLSPNPPIHACYATPDGRAGCVADACQASSLPAHRPPCHRTHRVPLATAAISGFGLRPTAMKGSTSPLNKEKK